MKPLNTVFSNKPSLFVIFFCIHVYIMAPVWGGKDITIHFSGVTFKIWLDFRHNFIYQQLWHQDLPPIFQQHTVIFILKWGCDISYDLCRGGAGVRRGWRWQSDVEILVVILNIIAGDKWNCVETLILLYTADEPL